MKLTLAKFLAEKIEDMSGEECQVHEDYSGRGMYGYTTAGIICERPLEVADVLVEAYLNADPDEVDALNEAMDNEDGFQNSFQFDSMARQYIVY